MKKMFLLATSVATLFAVVLNTTGCSGKKMKEKGAELITIYLRDFEEWSNEYFINAIKKFNENLEDGIEIDYKLFDDSAIETAISSAQQSGKNLDIYLVSYTNLFEQVNKKAVVPIENYFDEEFFADYTDAARYACTLYNKVYAVPYCFEASNLLFYSKTMFQKAGITSEPKSYEDMLECCEKLSKVISNTQTVISTPLGTPMGWANLGQFWNAANGQYPISDDWSTSLVKANKDGYVQFLNYYSQLYKKGYASRQDTAGGYNEIIGELCEGRVAMTFAGGYSIGAIYNEYIEQGIIPNADDIGCCFAPRLHQELSSTCNGGWSFVLNAGAAEKECTAEKAIGKKRGELAAKFLDWYTRSDMGQGWFELGKCCKQTGFKSMQEKLNISQVTNPYYEILKEATQNAPKVTSYPYEITSKLASMIVSMMLPTSHADPADLVDECDAEVQKIIDQNKLAGKNPR